jgi:DNA-binding CsgD family transcriptional regulator/tetratricopeptide (TPR) repeat protein
MAAFAEANAHFERAAELWDALSPEQRADSPSRQELLRRAAEAAHLSGATERAVALARSALALVDPAADPRAAARLHERIGRYLWVCGLTRDALDELGLAVSLMPDDAPAAERARMLGAEGHLLMLLGRGADARARCEAALALARDAGARAEQCRILNSLGPALVMTGVREDGLDALREARRLAEELGEREELTRSYINLAELLDQLGRLTEAVELSREAIAMAHREGIPAVLPMLIAELAGRLVRLGEWAEVDEILPEAIAPPTSWSVGRSDALCSRAQLQALRGDAAGAERTLREAEAEQRQAVGAMWTGPIAVARAEAALWDGRPDDARQVVSDELAVRDTSDHEAGLYLAPLIAAGTRAEAELAARARATGDSAGETSAAVRARELRDLGRELTADDALPEALLQIELATAETERAMGDPEPGMWAALVEGWDRHGARFTAAYCRWRLAELTLGAGGSRGEAPAILAAAHATAAQLGAVPLHRELEDLARRARIPLAEPGAADSDPTGASTERPPTVAERVGLTARELDVLRLLAGGATNREIAGQLFISQKTVTVHVTRILSKLDARSRVEAAGVAQRIGLLEHEATS